MTESLTDQVGVSRILDFVMVVEKVKKNERASRAQLIKKEKKKNRKEQKRAKKTELKKTFIFFFSLANHVKDEVERQGKGGKMAVVKLPQFSGSVTARKKR